METKVVCPVCGAEIEIAKHEHVATGVVIGEDSNLGTVMLPLKNKSNKPKTAEERMEILKNKGYDTSNLFSLDGKLYRPNAASAKLECVDEDPIIAHLTAAGYTYNPALFKQHVMSQFLRLAVTAIKHTPDSVVLEKHSVDYWGEKKTAWGGKVRSRIEKLGYDYAWQVVAMKLNEVSAAMRNGDESGAAETGLWYNKQLVIDMLVDYKKQLRANIDASKQHKCHGSRYVNIDASKLSEHANKRGLFCRLVNETERAIDAQIRKAEACSTAADLRDFVRAWNDIRPKFNTKDLKGEWTFKMPVVWVNAYEGYGAYFTAKNMIMFHGCKIKNVCEVNEYADDNEAFNTMLDMHTSLRVLKGYATSHQAESWKVTGMLRAIVINNNFDIEAKFNEWLQNKKK